MRTSGGRGAEGWIMAIPLVALLVATSMSAGGMEAMLISLEGTIRQACSSIVDFLARLL